MTFKIITLGCKLNSCESAAIEKSFLADGYTKVEKDDARANVYVINSCAVTGMAVTKARHALSRCRRENPNAVVALCGCYPQSYPDEAGLKFGADIVIGNADKSKLPRLVREFMKTRHKSVKIAPLSREYDLESAVPDMDRTRAFLKIEDGCDRFCSYCIIPTARGRVRSLPVEVIREQAAQCVDDGHHEIVLTGINLGCYGADLGLTLADAAKSAASSGVERLRLSSLEPEMMTDDGIARLAEVKALCPHFHLSLQSGSDGVLERMNRKYDTAQFRHVADKLRETFPGCSITTDMIVGFPGETDEEFAESLEFAREIGFAKIHVFPYSLRPGTVAAEMEQVHPSVRSERVEILTKAARDLECEFLQSQIGTEHTVLVERPQSKDYSHGFTESYIPVRIYGIELPRHTLADVKITEIGDGYCRGIVI
ncbi:MAG: tRNA (N(6)-L-threonylcarbamoyladenosine(37)-C(2))-methylthiotransferase MtaB [Oscillospiraceae bacterium]|nr:tRNA (N(6)-L-threonylcarbamoyladenosine(37)-C(2))-methylthiotransferase MtaB [Oscillospiraceae bacterium]